MFSIDFHFAINLTGSNIRFVCKDEFQIGIQRMAESWLTRNTPGILVLICAGLPGFVSGLAAGKGVQSLHSGLFFYLALFMAMGYWLTRDSKRRNANWAFDMGFFLYIAWPIIMPYYLFKTRGLGKGFLALVMFVGIYLASLFFGICAGVLLK